MKKQAELLLVDDEGLIRVALGRLLAQAGFNVTVLSSGDEAIRLLDERRFDVVVTDIVMEDINRPIVDGITVLEKAKQVNPATVVIIITGHASLGSMLEAQRKGAFSYFVKPCDNALLIKTIQDGLVMAQRNQAFGEAMALADAVKEAKRAFAESFGSAAQKTIGYGEMRTPEPTAYLDWLVEPIDRRQRRFPLLRSILERSHALSERMSKIRDIIGKPTSGEER